MDVVLLEANPGIVYTLLIIFSLIVGSFINVVIYRLPLQLKTEWRQQCEQLLQVPTLKAPKSINLWWPRSHCPHCQAPIPFWHLIPVLSYVWLRGHCHHCKTSIHWMYPIIELTVALSASLLYWKLGCSFIFLYSTLFVWLLIPLVVIDSYHQLLPDGLTLSLLWLGLIASTQQIFISAPEAILSSIGAYLSLRGILQVYGLFTGKSGMGHGDFKLFAALAAWFGWTSLPFILLLSSISGALIGMIYLKKTQQSKDSPFPFGPFLGLAGLLSLVSKILV